MKLIYGTSNAGKLAHMRRCLSGLGWEIAGLADMDSQPPETLETGATPLENARLKARAIFSFYRAPVFSCDSGLYLRGLPDALQPGVHVRNVNGKRLTDEEMTAYYGGLARRYGDLTARYQNAVCLILDEAARFESMADDLSGQDFILTAAPHQKREPGFPLDCLSVDPATGAYFYDLEDRTESQPPEAEGFVRFFRAALSSGMKTG